MKDYLKQVNMTIGRFQPFTKGHLRMCRDGQLKNGLPTVVMMITSGRQDSRHPFSNELIEKELEIVKRKYDCVLDVLYVKTADIVKAGQMLYDNGYEPQLWLCGDDRYKQYRTQAKNPKYREDGHLPDGFEPYTGTGRTEGVSATDVRNAIRRGNLHEFIGLMPDGCDTLFKEFREELMSVKESLSDYLIDNDCVVEGNLSNYLVDTLILEGGMGGHMRHPIDYSEFTGDDLKYLIQDLFSGRVEHMKEKLDGTNINAYRNTSGTTVYIRNNTDLNSEAGGMTIQDMSVKWADKPSVAKTFIEAGKIIKQVFDLVPDKFFNPDPVTKRIVNCECIVSGQTNVMIYAADRVAFHGYSEYTKTDNGWKLSKTVEGIPGVIAKAAERVKGAEQRPDLILKSVDEGKRLSDKFCSEVDKIFKAEGLSTDATIDGWKMKRFAEMCPEWLVPEDVYRRWFYQDKSQNMLLLKKKYSEKSVELKQLDMKGYQKIVQDVMRPLDTLFMNIGNALIDNLTGFTNQDNSTEISKELSRQLDLMVDDLKNSSDTDMDKLNVQLQRLEDIGNTINSAEGVVFVYRNRLMKLTGSFAAVNQIMGMQRFSR